MQYCENKKWCPCFLRDWSTVEKLPNNDGKTSSSIREKCAGKNSAFWIFRTEGNRNHILTAFSPKLHINWFTWDRISCILLLINSKTVLTKWCKNVFVLAEMVQARMVQTNLNITACSPSTWRQGIRFHCSSLLDLRSRISTVTKNDQMWLRQFLFAQKDLLVKSSSPSRHVVGGEQEKLKT